MYIKNARNSNLMKGGVVILYTISATWINYWNQTYSFASGAKGRKTFFESEHWLCDFGKFTVVTCEPIKTIKVDNYNSLDSQRMTLSIKYTFDKIFYIMCLFEKSSVDWCFSWMVIYHHTTQALKLWQSDYFSTEVCDLHLHFVTKSNSLLYTDFTNASNNRWCPIFGSLLYFDVDVNNAVINVTYRPPLYNYVHSRKYLTMFCIYSDSLM